VRGAQTQAAEMGGTLSVLRAHASLHSITAYDEYVCSHKEGEELDYKLRKLGVNRVGALGLMFEFKRLDDIKAGDLTPYDIVERLKVKDLSNAFVDRVFSSFDMQSHNRPANMKLDPEEFIFGIYYYATLTKEELATFAFHLYDRSVHTSMTDSVCVKRKRIACARELSWTRSYCTLVA
jgi:hypothetical protein